MLTKLNYSIHDIDLLGQEDDLYLGVVNTEFEVFDLKSNLPGWLTNKRATLAMIINYLVYRD